METNKLNFIASYSIQQFCNLFKTEDITYYEPGAYDKKDGNGKTHAFFSYRLNGVEQVGRASTEKVTKYVISLVHPTKTTMPDAKTMACVLSNQGDTDGYFLLMHNKGESKGILLCSGPQAISADDQW